MRTTPLTGTVRKSSSLSSDHRRFQILRRKDINALKGFLVGSPSAEGEWAMHCPLHEDSKRSASVNIYLGEWFCHAGCGGGSVAELLRRSDEWVNQQKSKEPSKQEDSDEPLPIEEDLVLEYAEELQENEEAKDWLIVVRGVWSDTITKYQIGLDRKSYTIPIRNQLGKLVNIRKYNPRPRSSEHSKIWSLKGYGGPRLYPMSSLASDSLVICEGEWDALATIQRGLPAITRTAAASVWHEEWNVLFRDKTVFLCHDRDTEGLRASAKVSKALRKVTEDVRIIELPYKKTEKHGKDISDYWNDDHSVEDFKKLAKSSKKVTSKVKTRKSKKKFKPTTLTDVLDGKHSGETRSLTATIKGKKSPGYTVPAKVNLMCTMDAGNICNHCPMMPLNGNAIHEIKAEDPVILEMIDTNVSNVNESIRRNFGAAHCKKLSFTIDEYQSIETLYVRGDLDSGEESEAGASVKIINVGRHDTPSNQTVKLEGALHPNPRSHENEFLVWQLDRSRTSIDNLTLTPLQLQQLRVFQPAEDQSPMEKLYEIAESMSNHVTGIYGRPDLHVGMDLVWHSAISFNVQQNPIYPGWLQFLVVGDTATGKSTISRKLTKHYKMGEIINCEAATIAGVLAGVQQIGRQWIVTWGALPMHDRRLVVLDEFAGLATQDISKLSEVRSSGKVIITKVVQESALARTRLIALANPRTGRMHDYAYGVRSLLPLIGQPEDLRRFDLVMTVQTDDVSSEEIYGRKETHRRNPYGSDLCYRLILWAWTRKSRDIVWTPKASEALGKYGQRLGNRYIDNPPLIQLAEVPNKLARISTAIAIRLFSTKDGEKVVVLAKHVQAAQKLLDSIYGSPSFGYLELSQKAKKDSKQALKSEQEIVYMLRSRPGLDKFFLDAEEFRTTEIESFLNVTRDEANMVINQLWEARMIKKKKNDIIVEPVFHQILRRLSHDQK